MRYNIKKEIEYIPSWNGNSVDEKPIKFYLRHLTVIERDDVFSPTTDETGKIHLRLNQLKTFKLGVNKIENLVVDGKEIIDAKTLISLPGFYELVIEVATKIMTMSAFDEEETKNLQ